MPKSKYSKLSVCSERQAGKEDLKNCKKVLCMDENNNVVQKYISPEQDVVKTVSRTEQSQAGSGLRRAISRKR